MAEKRIECPLLSRSIAEGLCLEIIMAGDGEIEKNAVPEVNDWEKAKNICPGCMAYYKH